MTGTTGMSTLDRMLELCDELLAQRNAEAAYHQLMAALHVVEVEGDREGLNRIVEAAAKQRAYVESAEPAHALSSESSTRRGTKSVYDTIRLHIAAVRERLEHPHKGSAPP